MSIAISCHLLSKSVMPVGMPTSDSTQRKIHFQQGLRETGCLGGSAMRQKEIQAEMILVISFRPWLKILIEALPIKSLYSDQLSLDQAKRGSGHLYLGQGQFLKEFSLVQFFQFSLVFTSPLLVIQIYIEQNVPSGPHQHLFLLMHSKGKKWGLSGNIQKASLSGH